MIRRVLLLAGALAPAAAFAQPTLSPAWSDHAVIQRDRPVVIEGTAAAGEKISATLGSQSAQATADRTGHFALTFPARSASADALTLTVTGTGGSATTVSDLVVGDVYLCSGQSNMEWPLSASVGGGPAVQSSADAGLRFLLVPKFTAAVPQDMFGAPATWTLSSPESSPPISAACYYMVRKLRQDLKIPIGAVNSFWGGSQIRAWVNPESAARLYGAAPLAQLRQYSTDPLAAVTAFAPEWQKWWTDRTHQSPWADPDVLTWQRVPQISAWGEWAGTPLATNGNGNVWMRRTVTLTPDQARSGGMLNIGLIDDIDMTFVNGRPVGNTASWSDERHYRVPAAYLKPGANEVVMLVTNSWGAGGMESKPDRLSFDMAGGASIPLGEGWQYAISPLTDYPPRAPWDGIAGIGVMHNRMIAPLGQFAMKGAAWYQGESDVGIPGYADRLRELFAGWRRQFGDPLQVIVIQLPNYGDRSDQPVDAGWARVRDEERRAIAADPNGTLVPTLDVGQFDNLHPPDKLPVGLRMAMAAEGKPMPMPAQVFKAGEAYALIFEGIEGRLQSWSSNRVLGVELCAETQDSCRFADASATLNGLLIADDGKPATRVRYAWSDAPVVNLFDGRGLPIPGFELPIAP